MNYTPRDLSISKILFSVIVFSLTYYFSDPETSDQIFNVSILVFMVFSFKNKDLLSTLILLALARLLIEGGWWLLDGAILSKTLLYIASLTISSLLFYDRCARVQLVVLALVVVSEFYWFYSDYDAPGVWWGVLLASVMLVHRHVFFLRAPFLNAYIKPKAFKSTDLDFYIYVIATIQFCLYSLSNAEYLIRHIGKINITLFYSVTPEFVHATNILLFVLLFNAAIKQINLHLFHA